MQIEKKKKWASNIQCRDINGNKDKKKISGDSQDIMQRVREKRDIGNKFE